MPPIPQIRAAIHTLPHNLAILESLLLENSKVDSKTFVIKINIEDNP